MKTLFKKQLKKLTRLTPPFFLTASTCSLFQFPAISKDVAAFIITVSVIVSTFGYLAIEWRKLEKFRKTLRPEDPLKIKFRDKIIIAYVTRRPGKDVIHAISLESDCPPIDRLQIVRINQCYPI